MVRTYEELLAQVVDRGGLPSADAAGRPLDAVLAVLGGALPEVHTRALAARLPRRAAVALLAGIDLGPEPARDLPRSLARLENVTLERAAGHLVIVGRVLGDLFDEHDHARLRHLPAALREHFERAAAPGASPPAPPLEAAPHASSRAVGMGAGPTLASGRPGSLRPLSESSPAQRRSLVRDENPGAERKLSSTHGRPADETLAGGRPGSTKPLSEADG